MSVRTVSWLDGRDQGFDVANGLIVRVSAKELTALIMDEERLRSERSDRKLWKSRVSGLDDYHGFGNEPIRRPERRERRPRNDDDDEEYRKAIEASKAEAEEERRRREKAKMAAEEDDDLAKAIKLSKEEEELRRRELEESNAQSLFDDTPAQAQPTGYNQGYQQQPAVDWFGNPVDTQQPMTTGYLNNQYAQPTGFQTQPTGYQNGYTNGLQMQPTGYNQMQYSQAQSSFLQPQPTLQPQQTAFSNNPYGTDVWGQQQQQQQPQQQQNDYLQPGSHNPWAGQQPSAEALKPMPTGSNNPFASSFTRQQLQTQSQPQRPQPPSLNTLAEERTTTQFNNTANNPILNYRAPSPPRSTPPQVNQDPHVARLNALLATGEGQDTFGNVGDLRIPAQHTAPGTFVNSAGQGLDRLRAQQTGNNPFLTQSFTGVPRQTGYMQQNVNPYGGQQGFQQQPQQGGSLIDL